MLSLFQKYALPAEPTQLSVNKMRGFQSMFSARLVLRTAPASFYRAKCLQRKVGGEVLFWGADIIEN
jgi:hypothetical protein